MKTSVSNNIAVFGYGSLVNIQSLQQTIGRLPEHVYYVNLQNWVREWTIAVANNSLKGRYIHAETEALPDHILALNIHRDQSSAFGVNGVLFEVTETDLDNLDDREFCYERIDVTTDILGPHPFDTVYTYAGLKEFLISPEKPAIIPASYEAVVADGFKSIDDLAYLWYKQSTRPSPHKVEPTEYVLG